MTIELRTLLLKSWNSQGVTSLECGVLGLEKLAGDSGLLTCSPIALFVAELVRFRT
jgi:hypothetical protein